MDQNMLLKIASILFTLMCHLTGSFSYKGVPFSLENLMLAKRGGKGIWGLEFKGKEFEIATYAPRHEDIVLECEAGGSPTPTIHWLKNGERIQQEQSRDFLNDEAAFENHDSSRKMLHLGKVKSKLYLDCVTDRDEAEYTCVAETPYNRITKSTQLKMDNELPAQSRASCLTKKAFRGEPARVNMWTEMRIEFQGADVQLFCRAEGYPKPNCAWRYTEQGERIVDNEKYKLLPNGDLLIRQISFFEDMGEYYCACENEAGIDEVATFLYPTSP